MSLSLCRGMLSADELHTAYCDCTHMLYSDMRCFTKTCSALFYARRCLKPVQPHMCVHMSLQGSHQSSSVPQQGAFFLKLLLGL